LVGSPQIMETSLLFVTHFSFSHYIKIRHILSLHGIHDKILAVPTDSQ